MKSKTTKPRIFVEVTAIWGNGDAHSTIRLSRRRWNEIQAGSEYDKSTYSYYEGVRYTVSWEFINSKVSVYGGDGMECMIDKPLTELMIEIIP